MTLDQNFKPTSPLRVPDQEVSSPSRQTSRSRQKPTNGLDENSKTALRVHDRLVALRKAGKLKSVASVDLPLPRVRKADDVDISKADSNCNDCKGKGIKSYIEVEELDEKIPVICKCVARGGGVKKDQYDRIMEGQHNMSRQQKRALDRRLERQRAANSN